MRARHMEASIGFVVLAAIVVLLVVAGPTTADHGPEEPRAESATIDEPIEPLGPPGETMLGVTVPCEGNQTGTVWLDAELVEAPAFLAFEGGSLEADVVQRCGERHALVAEVPVEIAFTEDAPAFDPVLATVDVHVQRNGTDGNVTELEPARTEVTATPDYFNSFSIDVEPAVAEGGPDEGLSYTITIDNFSNADTRFEFGLAGDGESLAGFQPVVPSPVVVRSNATEGDSVLETTFNVFTPFHNGWVNEVRSIQLQVDSFYAAETSIEGDSTEISTLAKARGLHVPGPGAIVAAVSLLGVGLVVGRERR